MGLWTEDNREPPGPCPLCSSSPSAKDEEHSVNCTGENDPDCYLHGYWIDYSLWQLLGRRVSALDTATRLLAERDVVCPDKGIPDTAVDVNVPAHWAWAAECDDCCLATSCGHRTTDDVKAAPCKERLVCTPRQPSDALDKFAAVTHHPKACSVYILRVGGIELYKVANEWQAAQHARIINKAVDKTFRTCPLLDKCGKAPPDGSCRWFDIENRRVGLFAEARDRAEAALHNSAGALVDAVPRYMLIPTIQSSDTGHRVVVEECGSDDGAYVRVDDLLNAVPPVPDLDGETDDDRYHRLARALHNATVAYRDGVGAHVVVVKTADEDYGWTLALRPDKPKSAMAELLHLAAKDVEQGSDDRFATGTLVAVATKMPEQETEGERYGRLDAAMTRAAMALRAEAGCQVFVAIVDADNGSSTMLTGPPDNKPLDVMAALLHEDANDMVRSASDRFTAWQRKAATTTDDAPALVPTSAPSRLRQALGALLDGVEELCDTYEKDTAPMPVSELRALVNKARDRVLARSDAAPQATEEQEREQWRGGDLVAGCKPNFWIWCLLNDADTLAAVLDGIQRIREDAADEPGYGRENLLEDLGILLRNGSL